MQGDGELKLLNISKINFISEKKIFKSHIKDLKKTMVINVNLSSSLDLRFC